MNFNDLVLPMLLEEKDEIFNSLDYIYEVKYDGIRALIYVTLDSIKIISRNGLDITYMFPELDIIRKLVNGNVIFDGEIILINDDKISFYELQKRIHLKNIKTINYLSKTNPCIYVAFDILYDNISLIDKELLERKKYLNKYKDNKYFYKVKYYSNGKKLFNKIKELDLEGIVAKNKYSTYLVNKRSNDWIKIKNYKENYFTIIGYKEHSDKVSITLYLANNCRYVGKVSIKRSKIIDKLIGIKKVKNEYKNIKDKDVIYVEKVYQCLVKYREITANGYLREAFIP